MAYCCDTLTWFLWWVGLMAQLQGEGIAVALQGSVRGGWLGG